MNRGFLMNRRSPMTIVRLTILLLTAVAVVALPISAAAEASAAATDATKLIDHLRDRDQTLERLARRMAHPEGAPVDGDELRRFVRSLERLDLWIGPLAEDYPDLAVKHQALLARARQLANASTRSRAENADLVASDASVRRLQLESEAFVPAESGTTDAARSACEAAPTMSAETRALPGLDGSRDALVRFVAPSDGRYLVDTDGSRTDTRIRVLSGCGTGDDAILADGDDESSLRAQTQFSAHQGEEVWIRVGTDRADHVRLAIEQLTEGVGTASIAGTVTAQASGLPIEGLSVRAEDDSFGTYFSSTDVSGNFEFTSLPAGTYEVHTRDVSGDWVNEIWDDIECGVGSGACFGHDGDPIVVAEGQAVQNIDFALGRVSVLSGTITDSSSGEPIEGVLVELLSGGFSYTETDALGRFRFSNVAPGTSYLAARSQFFGVELYDDIPCPPLCDLTDGTPIEVTADSVISGLDFALDRFEGVSGLVTASAHGSTLGRGSVYVYDDQGLSVGSENVLFDGTFFVPVPEPGTYFAVLDFSSFEEWVDQMWQGVNCPEDCDLGLATPIELGANEVDEISFEVLGKGRIEGNVAAADDGSLSDQFFSTYVRAYDEAGNFRDGDFADEVTGNYLLTHLDGGNHFVSASNGEFRSEIYDDIACTAGNVCDPLLGDPVAVAFDATTSGIDFELDRLGVISGTVTSAGVGTAISSVTIFAASASWPLVDAYTDNDGDYRLVGLEPDTYTLYTESGVFVDEAFDDLPCEGGCDLTMADPVMIPALGTHFSGIDFALEREAWIEGTVTDASSGDPIDGYVYLYRFDGTLLRSDYADFGEYLLEGLDDGSYFLLTQVFDDIHVDELFEDLPCPNSSGVPVCDPTTGTAVAVSVESGAVVDFELDVGGAIEGTLKDVFGNPVSGRVYAFDAMGTMIEDASASIGVGYRIEGLPAGDYFLVTRSTGHQDELWPDQPCFGQPFPNCALGDGIPVSVSLGATTGGIDFVLQDLATISGTVVDDDSGQAVSDAYVDLYNESGSLVGFDANPFALTEIPPGTYFLRTISSAEHIERVYGGDLCTPSCDPTTGTPIVVDIGDVVTGIEIPLPMGPGIKGRVFDGPTGNPLGGFAIDLWNTSGHHVDSAVTDADGWFRLPGAYGTHYISTYNEDGLEDFLYDAIPCPDGSAWEGLCDPTEGTPYHIEQYSPLQRLDLPFGDPTVFTDGFESGDTSAWSVSVGD